MRSKLIVGNWKMNCTPPEAEKLASDVVYGVSRCCFVKVAIAPSFLALEKVKSMLKFSSILLAAQNVHWEDRGAFTGEVSAGMLASIGVEYVIIGHSERRRYFGETNTIVNSKVKKALATGLKPIICIGETLEERTQGRYLEVLCAQLTIALDDIDSECMIAQQVIIAYEPVWAIGTGQVATDDQAQEVHACLRRRVADLYGQMTADRISIIYGGSMNQENAAGLLAMPDIDGGLIGGASLDASKFSAIVKAASDAWR